MVTSDTAKSTATAIVDVKYQIWAFVDSHGNTEGAVVKESSDTMFLSTLKDRVGNHITFESEAYHVMNWCDNHGIRYRAVDKTAHVCVK